ncbi:MAG: acyltransferase family protein [Terriglobales bacterium]
MGYLRAALHDLNLPAPGNVPGLDALRTMAILLVVMVHTQESVGSHIPFVGAGWTGVDLFFVLSGYLIGRQLWKEAQTGRIRIGRFLLRRGLRMWPLYFFSALVIWALHGGGYRGLTCFACRTISII